MKVISNLLALISIIFVVTSVALAQNAKRIPMRDFFRNPDNAYYEVSLDGNYLAFLKPYKNRMNIFIEAMNSNEARQVTSVTDRDIQMYFWKGSNHICYLKDNGGDEIYHLFSVSMDGENEVNLTPFDSTDVTIVDYLLDNDTDVLIGMNKRDREIFDVYRLNTVTGELKMAAENPGNISNWITDHDGYVRLAVASDGINASILYRDSEQDSFKVALITNFKESLSPLFFTFDNKAIYATSNLGRDKSAIVKYDIANGRELEVIYENPEVDAAGLLYSWKRKVLTEINYTTWKDQRIVLDQKRKELYDALEANFPGYEIELTSMDINETVFVLRTFNDRTLGSYYTYEVKSGKIIKLADSCPWLQESDLVEMKPISYKSRDGLTINGYLSLPKGKDAKNLPVVVNPHGGPWNRNTWGYNPEVQFLANRGYAIFQINYRGSTGYGKNFWEASFKEWGKKMQDDITDGVAWLIDQKIADPKKIAIYGGSYGGYATLCGLAFTPNLYCCGIDYVGVSNLFTFLESFPPTWKPFLDMFHEMVGDPQKDSLLLISASPVFYADSIKVPLLIAQGANDPRVNINESNQMVEALKKRGIDVPYMVKENEGHGFDNEENRFEFYQAMEDFLAKYL